MIRISAIRRTTAASLLLAAVVSLTGVAGCRPDPTPPPTVARTAATTGSGGTSEWTATDGRFTLEVKPGSGDPTTISVVVTDARSAFDEMTDEQLEGLIEVRSAAPLLGSIEKISGREISFSPSFPLLAGQEYLVRFLRRAEQGADRLECRYRVPAPEPSPAPTVTAVYPTSTVLPANHLKFYIVFSEPMQPGEIWGYFQLDDLDNNRPVPRPFRHTELWSRDRRTLTLWFHPGRVKQGVNLNVELGAILVEGRRYRLSISGDWPSARGTPLGDAVTREFTAGPADHQQPDLAKWKITVPAVRSFSPLVCGLGSPHDWALLRSDVRVETAAGRPVVGTIQTNDHESTWTFTPQSAWQPGRYRLAVGSVLEDLAGNSLERPFEVDVTDAKSAEPTSAATRYREFTIQP
ncbi:MAG TPA: hypothetical protein DCE47_22615 [Planctomycetaceae bacterium]|nr:hypothetical protein [Planctomycetaceae bacterium]HCD01052.1 hypothetical protein [Planctomycetaceae bacterium]